MTKPVVHLVCQAHLVPIWLWEWEEGAAEAISTFRTAADLCEEFDGFVFNHNEVILYEWVEEYEPVLFARIQRLVREGKWHIMGGWFLQPDCNMPSGESFVRQILAGRRYFGAKFGARPTTAINFDPFGHSRGLVQIMAKSGYDSYVFCRPGAPEPPYPGHEFVWVGYDGSEVMASRPLSWYNSPLGKAADKVRAHLAAHADKPSTILLWGVGNHGGGPSRADLRQLRDLFAETTAAELRHSTPEAYFAQVAERRAQLPRHAHDLNPWAIGCYISQIRIKQRHRRLENELYATEKMLAAAAMQGLLDYPSAPLREAERDLLFAEFHDILPGSSIQPAEDAALRLMDHGLEILSRLKARAFFALAGGQPRAAEGEIPILVYNPHPYPVRCPVACEFQLADQNWEPTFTVPTVHRDGVAIPSQVEKELSNLNLDWRKRVVFAAELAPGMNRFDCRLARVPERPRPELRAEGDRIRFRTPEIEAEISTVSGLLASWRVAGAEQLAGEAFRPLVVADSDDPWEMGTIAFRQVAGAFTLTSPSEAARVSGLRAAAVPPAVRVIEDGPVRSVVEAVFEYGVSRLILTYFLPKKGTELGLEARVFWNEKGKLLKLAVPVAFSGTLHGQVAYGRQELPSNGNEAVAQKWLAVVDTAEDRALTCITEGTYAADFAERELRLTLLRSPAYSGHPIKDRPVVPQDRFLPRIDQGERVFRFWLNAGAASERLACIDREALAANESPFALSFFPNGGGKPLPPAVTLDGDSTVLLTALKQAENGDGWIARLFAAADQGATCRLRVPGLGIDRELRLGPWEIASLRLGSGGQVEAVNLLEESGK
ncbi:MAG: glycoside hydrolase family 38 C-terminal domain-containing protein [Lentisphaeria bacterium]|jgi:alpha-mannosidase|nr:glycoside hydrolase family 38 C-terminal domain-containing protein [Lentisphaeria bacterium]